MNERNRPVLMRRWLVKAQRLCRRRSLARGLLRILPVSLGLLMTSCANLNPSDSFCGAYQPIANQKGVGSISTTTEIKNRLAANEKTYLCNCSQNAVLKARICT